MKSELTSNCFRRSLDVIAGILIACTGIGGCAKPSTIRESKEEPKPYEWRVAEGDVVVVALAYQECSGTGCRMKFYESRLAPSIDRKFRFDAIADVLAKRSNVKATDVSSAGVTVNPDDTPSMICDRLSEKGLRGLLVVVMSGSSERFGIGLSCGVIHVETDVWEIAQKRREYGNRGECVKFTPLLWIVHYHKFSGELNDEGRLAFRSALEKALL